MRTTIEHHNDDHVDSAIIHVDSKVAQSAAERRRFREANSDQSDPLQRHHGLSTSTATKPPQLSKLDMSKSKHDEVSSFAFGSGIWDQACEAWGGIPVHAADVRDFVDHGPDCSCSVTVKPSMGLHQTSHVATAVVLRSLKECQYYNVIWSTQQWYGSTHR